MKHIYSLIVGFILLVTGTVALAEAVDINTATAEQLSAAMKDIGKVKAEAIVQEREKNGPFKSIDDLSRVKGIKAATINKNRDAVTIGGVTSAAAEPAVKGIGLSTPVAPKAPPPPKP